jgi:hypothetical protein
MKRRSVSSWIALASVFAATIVAGCAKDYVTNDPRLAFLVPISGDGQAGPVGSTLSQPFVVKVVDQDGLPVTGESVVWVVATGGGSVSSSQSPTDVAGEAATSLRLGTAVGPNVVLATLGQLNPVPFAASATAAPPTKVTVVSGDGQTAGASTQLPLDLVVKVTDAGDNPTPGVLVTFAIASGGGTPSAFSGVTGATGIASFRWTLGPTGGIQVAIASVSGLSPAVFTATALAGAPEAVTILTRNNPLTPARVPFQP